MVVKKFTTGKKLPLFDFCGLLTAESPQKS
jgi:hypothetical protein